MRGLKDALTQGSVAAVSKLGVENGFLGNDRVKIPLPDALQRVAGGLRLNIVIPFPQREVRMPGNST